MIVPLMIVCPTGTHTPTQAPTRSHSLTLSRAADRFDGSFDALFDEYDTEGKGLWDADVVFNILSDTHTALPFTRRDVAASLLYSLDNNPPYDRLVSANELKEAFRATGWEQRGKTANCPTEK